MNKDSRILVTGNTGMIGTAVSNELVHKGYILCASAPTHIINCAGHISNDSVETIDRNYKIQSNIFRFAVANGVKKLLNIASSSVYPVNGRQPYTENQVGTGKTDPNWPYAIAKIAGIELCRAYHKQYGCDFMTVIPCSIYGPHSRRGVILDLINNFYESNGKQVEIKGSDLTRREFLCVDDFAKAVVMLMEKYNYKNLHDGVVNVGFGNDNTIGLLAMLIRSVVMPDAKYGFDNTDVGVRSRLMDSSLINRLGWKPETQLLEGIKKTYRWYLAYRTHNQPS